MNDPVSDQSYENKKYFAWSRRGGMSEQDADPSLVSCSFCGRRTHRVWLIVKDRRDYLVCGKHVKGEQYEVSDM